MVKGFCGFPGTALGFGFSLQIAAREVNGHGPAPDMFRRFFDRNIAAAFADCGHEFHLVVQIICHRGIRDLGDVVVGNRKNGVRGLHEKARQRPARAAHFEVMRTVVAAHAVDAVHRKVIVFAAPDGNNGLLAGRKHEHD